MVVMVEGHDQALGGLHQVHEPMYEMQPEGSVNETEDHPEGGAQPKPLQRWSA